MKTAAGLTQLQTPKMPQAANAAWQHQLLLRWQPLSAVASYGQETGLCLGCTGHHCAVLPCAAAACLGLDCTMAYCLDSNAVYQAQAVTGHRALSGRRRTSVPPLM